jgi:hypothetical protein
LIVKYRALLTVLLLLSPRSAVAADGSSQLPSAEEIVARMGARDLQRQARMEGYVGTRRYVLENRHLHKHAEMLARVQGEGDGTKHFAVLSEDGWNAANKHVLRKMVESEAETSRPEMRSKTKINTENYDFEVVGIESVGDRTSYVLEVNPKRKDKYLFQGRIWVDVEDYALVRVEGSPAKNPSFWTKSTHFVQTYKKSGPVWFPVSTQSTTEVRVFGTTNVNIEYFNYAPKKQSSENIVASAPVMDRP